MKKHFELARVGDNYQLSEGSKNSSLVIGADLQFDVKEYYKLVFEDVVENCEIEIENKCASDDKTGSMVCNTIKNITEKACKRMNEECFANDAAELSAENDLLSEE
jgi:hypothetical protein